jgi:hypothetical protein
MIKDAISEFFGLVSNGMIHAAILADGRIWARKTMLPDNLLDVLEIKAAANLPQYIQALCNGENQNWLCGTDRNWNARP